MTLTRRAKFGWLMTGLICALIGCGGGAGSGEAQSSTAKGASCTEKDVSTCEAMCTKRDMESCYQLGVAQQFEKLPGGTTAAAKSYEKACAANHEFACDNLASLLLQGSGVPKNVPRAIELWTKSCDVGSPNGCGNLAVLYGRGEDVPADYVRAFNLLDTKVCTEQAAKKDAPAFLRGCIQLAFQLARGLGTAPDPDRAAHILDTECKAGVKPACDTLHELFVPAPK